MDRRTFLTLSATAAALAATRPKTAFAAPLLDGQARRLADKARVRLDWTGGATASVFLSADPDAPPLLAPMNEMSYDIVSFYNNALAIVGGLGVAALSFRLLPPLAPAYRTRRLLAAALRDLRRLILRPTARTMIWLTSTNTSSPRASSASHRCDPMKPAPPVTRTRIKLPFPGENSAPNGHGSSHDDRLRTITRSQAADDGVRSGGHQWPYRHPDSQHRGGSRRAGT